MTTKELQEAIAAYNDAIQEKERLAEEVKENNALVERCRNELADAMLEAEVPSMETTEHLTEIGHQTGVKLCEREVRH